MRPSVSSAPPAKRLKPRNLFHVVPCDWSKLWSPCTATSEPISNNIYIMYWQKCGCLCLFAKKTTDNILIHGATYQTHNVHWTMPGSHSNSYIACVCVCVEATRKWDKFVGDVLPYLYLSPFTICTKFGWAIATIYSLISLAIMLLWALHSTQLQYTHQQDHWLKQKHRNKMTQWNPLKPIPLSTARPRPPQKTGSAPAMSLSVTSPGSPCAWPWTPWRPSPLWRRLWERHRGLRHRQGPQRRVEIAQGEEKVHKSYSWWVFILKEKYPNKREITTLYQFLWLPFGI